MLPYYITIPIDDDFGINRSNYWSNTPSLRYTPDGILRYNTTSFHSQHHGMMSSVEAVVDVNLLKNKNFFKPLEAILSQDIKLNDITQKDFEKIMSKFGEFEKRSDRSIVFNFDNFYDLELAYIDKKKNGSTRLCLRYINSPVSSFYIINDGSSVLRVMMGVFTKDYYVMTEYQWLEFVNYIKKNMDLSEQRDLKIGQILDEKTSENLNILRQLKFIVSKDRRKSNRFLDSVYDYYEKNGFITEKQSKCVGKYIW
jgi:hypothetical protein